MIYLAIYLIACFAAVIGYIVGQAMGKRSFLQKIIDHLNSRPGYLDGDTRKKLKGMLVSISKEE